MCMSMTRTSAISTRNKPSSKATRQSLSCRASPEEHLLCLRAEPASLSNEEIARYSRHLILPEVGMDGQLKLKQAKVALIGAGGLGAPAGPLSGRCRHRAHRHCRFRCGRCLQSATPSDSRNERHWPKKLDSAADSMRDINPYHADRQVRHRIDQRKCARDSGALRYRDRWHRQLPDALSGQRRLCPVEEA